MPTPDSSKKTWINYFFFSLVLIFLGVLSIWALFWDQKTVWDLLELFIVPITLAGVGFWYSNHRAMIDYSIENERQQDLAMQTYYDQIAELLLEKGLRTSEPLSEIQEVARIRTLSVLRNVDGKRKGMILQFLHEASLIKKGNIVDCEECNETVSLRGANLTNTCLPGVDLYQVRLGYVDFSNANLSKSWLLQAWLEQANLTASDLSMADLSEANLNGIILNKAILVGTKLVNSTLRSASLVDVNLCKANLSGADLTNANLAGAILDKANLLGAKVTIEGLAKVKSLKSTIMPDGRIHR